MIEVTQENYYSPEVDREYMSAHQYLEFAGYMGVRGCEARAMAKLRGEWKEDTTTAMLVGSYVDSYFEGTLDRFTAEHPECFTKKGELKAEYKMANTMISRCEESEVFMNYMSGEKQVIMTGYLFGTNWKIKMDSYVPGVCISDLKTSAKIHDQWKVLDYGWVCFAEYWGYVVQLAIYQKIVEINTGHKLPCYLPTVTKEKFPEAKVVYVDQMSLDHALNTVEMNMPSILAVKSGEIEPIRCGRCDYCKTTEVLTGPIRMQDLILGE